MRSPKTAQAPASAPLEPQNRLSAPAWLRTSIAEQIGVAAALLALSFALLIGLTSFFYTLHLTREAGHSHLVELARDAATRLSAALEAISGDTALLAGNPSLVSAVTGAKDPATQLTSLLSNYRPATRRAASICVIARDGRLLACDQNGRAEPGDIALVDSIVRSGAPGARIVERGREATLQIARPVTRRGGKQPQPAAILVSDYAIDQLMQDVFGSPDIEPHLLLAGSDGRELFRRGSSAGMLRQSQPLAANPLLQQLGLTLEVGLNERDITAPVRRLVIVYTALAMLLLPVTYLSARHLGRALSRRLRRLAEESRELSVQDVEAWMPRRFGDDEVGDVAQALQRLAGQLRKEQENLEAKVAARTFELAEAAAQLSTLSTALEQSPTAVLMTDAQGCIQYVNRQFEQVTGYAMNEVLGRNPRILKSKRKLPYEYATLWETISTGGIWHGEFENVRKDGRHYWVLASIAPLRNIDGAITGYVAVEEDVTERRRIERETREREHYLAALLDSLPDLLFVFDHAGRITGYRAPNGDLLVAPEKFVGRHFGEVLPQSVARPLGAILEDLRGHDGVRQLDYELDMPRGRQHFSASIRRISGDDPARDGFVVLARDVTEAHALQQQLVASEARFRTLLEEVNSVAVQGYNRNRRVVFWNKASEALYGYTRDEALGRTLDELIIPPPIREAVVAAVDAWVAGGPPIPAGELTLQRKDGSPVHVYSSHAMQPNIAGQPEMYCVDIDLSARKAAEAQMREALVVFNASSQAIMSTRADGTIVAINPAFTAITGYTARDVVGRNASMFRSGRHDAAFYEALRETLLATGSWEGEIWNRRKNGELYPQWLTVSAVRDDAGAILEFVSLFSDISLRKQQEELIWRQANFDALTGLANRNLLKDRLERAIAQARRNGKMAGVLFLDLDGFKAVNDTYGHSVGDELLVEVAQRLTACVREQDTVARIGGDEFTLVIHDVADLEHMRAVGGKVVATLREPFTLSTGGAQLSGSVGITVFPDDGLDAETLLKHADIAMYAAKQEGKDRVAFYRGSMTHSPRATTD